LIRPADTEKVTGTPASRLPLASLTVALIATADASGPLSAAEIAVRVVPAMPASATVEPPVTLTESTVTVP